MNADVMTKLLGVGRLLTGLWFLAKPQPVARTWVGVSDTPTDSLVRSVGGREAALGCGLIALAESETAPAWIAASIAFDVTDAITAATFLDGDQRRETLLYAGGFAVLGAITLFAATR